MVTGYFKLITNIKISVAHFVFLVSDILRCVNCVYLECGRKTSILPSQLHGHVCSEHIYSGMGAGGRLWIWRVGEHEQLHQAS
jgi:hypothetical protein